MTTPFVVFNDARWTAPIVREPPNKGGHPRDKRLEALYERAAEWLAEDVTRSTRDAAKLIAPEYRDDWDRLQPIEKNDRVNDIRKRIDAYLLAVAKSAK